MPFEFWITRSDLPEQGIQLRSGGFLDKFKAAIGRANSQSPISQVEFHRLFANEPAKALEDGKTYWFRHPAENVPCFAAEWVPISGNDGYIKVAISHLHYRFLFALGTTLSWSFQAAQSIGASLFEESGQREITPANAAQFFDPKGDFAGLLAKSWRAAISDLDANGQAPLEYPLGPIDGVSDYFVFHIRPEKTVSHRQLVEDLALDTEGDIDEGVMVIDKTCKTRLTKLLVRPDGKIQVWPYYLQEPFAKIAKSTLAIASSVHAYTGGDINFGYLPLTGELRQNISQHLDGLGVEFFIWLQSQASS
jgi:hypothetical protein